MYNTITHVYYWTNANILTCLGHVFAMTNIKEIQVNWDKPQATTDVLKYIMKQLHFLSIQKNTINIMLNIHQITMVSIITLAI